MIFEARPSLALSPPSLCLLFVGNYPTSAYQIEGAWNESGKGPSIWDTFTHTPGKILEDDNGDVSADHYHNVPGDVNLLESLGVSHYRMSLSWSRIFPTGRAPINEAGVEYYRNELALLKAKGIEPVVTLYHSDLPQALQDEGGWLNKSTLYAFLDYANASFRLFGPQIKVWVTLNEPWGIAWQGYGLGTDAPGRCSDRTRCDRGNSSSEPYIVGHNLLLAHALAVRAYRSSWQSAQEGKIGIVLDCDWAEPLDFASMDDQIASQRYLEFMLSWFADPIYLGKYPDSMYNLFKERYGGLKLFFNSTERTLLTGSSDFFGLNHYTSVYASARENSSATDPLGGWGFDVNMTTLRTKKGKPIGLQGDSDWLYEVPWGIRKLLQWIHERYNTSIWITENGFDVKDESLLPKDEALKDDRREYYLKSYLQAILAAIHDDGVPVAAYFVWSFIDNFEWAEGYQRRFGLYYVDYEHNLTRTEKLSAKWYRNLIQFNRDASKAQSKSMSTAFWVGLGLVVGIGLAISIVITSVILKNCKGKEAQGPRYVPLRQEVDDSDSVEYSQKTIDI